MAGMDRFDDPTLSTEEIEFEKEGMMGKVGGLAQPVKKNLKYIIAVVVVLAAGFFAYNYFIGSVETVTISIVNTEGEDVDASLKVYPKSSEEAIFSESGDSSYTLQLRHGSYRAEAKATGALGYAVKTASIEVAPGDTEKEIEVVKNLDVEILGFGDAFPLQLFAGQVALVEVQVRNSSSGSLDIALVPEGDLEDFAGKTAATVLGNSTETVTVEVNVPEGTQIKDDEGDEKKAKLRVEFTKEDAEAEFTLLPDPLPNITLSDADFSVKAIEGKDKDTDTIRVNNRNDFALENLELSVEITAAPTNGEARTRGWFKFSEVANQEQPWIISIGSIPAGKKVEKELQVDVPLTAQRELDIKGNIVLSADYFKMPLKNTITLDITEAAEHGIGLKLSPRSPYEIEWDSTQGRYAEEIVELEVENTGQIDLEEINFFVDNQVICDVGWLDFLESTIDSLGAGDEEVLRLHVTAPIYQRGNETTMHCNLRYHYLDPLQPGEFAGETIVDFLQITPEAE